MKLYRKGSQLRLGFGSGGWPMFGLGVQTIMGQGLLINGCFVMNSFF